MRLLAAVGLTLALVMGPLGALPHAEDVAVSTLLDTPPARPNGQVTRIVLAPRVDADGNEIAGVRAVALQAPLGTHTGWNLRAAGFMEDAPCYLNGSFIPFAATAAERLPSGDPRPSLEERYGTREG
jgi:hypothetical protein